MDLSSDETVNEGNVEETRRENENEFYERPKRLKKQLKRYGYSAVNIGTPVPPVHLTEVPQITEDIRQICIYQNNAEIPMKFFVHEHTSAL